MSAAQDHDPGRRRFLAGTTAAGITVTASGEVAALPKAWTAAARASVVLHDPRILLSQAVQQRLGANGARTMPLTGDPVRLWRSEAGAPLRDSSTTLLGVTGWADLLIFRGMAAETRRHLRYERLDAATGSFIWLIA